MFTLQQSCCIALHLQCNYSLMLIYKVASDFIQLPLVFIIDYYIQWHTVNNMSDY